jgi:hypothetical protein
VERDLIPGLLCYHRISSLYLCWIPRTPPFDDLHGLSSHLQLDSLKSRLQSSREAVSLPRLAADVVREEGVGGWVWVTHKS